MNVTEESQEKTESEKEYWAEKRKQTIRDLIIRKTNREIQKEIELQVPEFIYSRRAIEHMTYSANQVSNRFGKPTELIGLLESKESQGKLYFTSYHVFKDQQCNGVNTMASAMGRLDTFKELREKKIQAWDVAHSHNDMSVFHSPLDDKLLEMETKTSSRYVDLMMHGTYLDIPFATSTVFNQRGEIFIKGGVMTPRLTDTGFKSEYTEFTPKHKFIEYGELEEIEKNRLDSEIETRVQYRDRIMNNGFLEG